MASGIVEGPDGVLLVKNQRRDGRAAWSPPGGVVEVEQGETVLDGLTREVREETGITVTDWQGPLWHVEAEAEGMGWRLRVEVYRAVDFSGDLHVEDEDGIVVDARFVPCEECDAQLAGAWLPLTEPMGAWLAERWSVPRAYRYRVDGTAPAELSVVRLP